MNKRFRIRNAALRIIAGAACLCPLLAANPCLRTTLGATGVISSSTVTPPSTVVFTLDDKLGPIIKGKDPLHLNGSGGSATASISASATPTVSTATSATYSLPAGAVQATLGGLTFANTAPWTLTIKLGASSDTLVLSGPGPDGTAFTSTSSLAAQSFPPSALINPAPFSPPQQDLTSPTSTLAYSDGCVVGIPAGSDYFTTGAGTSAKILKQTIPLTGVPIDNSGEALGNTDTIVQRMADAVFSADAIDGVTPDTPPTVTIPITLAALQLTGTYGTLPNNACTMNVTIQGSPASTGTMTLKLITPTGGTFTSDFVVYFVATFTPIAPNTKCPKTVKGHHTIKLGASSTGVAGTWSTTPLPGEVLVTGLYPDPNANQHTGLPPGFVDFYATSVAQHLGVTVQHFVCEALTTSTGANCK
jgi:hypothetical protein